MAMTVARKTAMVAMLFDVWVWEVNYDGQEEDTAPKNTTPEWVNIKQGEGRVAGDTASDVEQESRH